MPYALDADIADEVYAVIDGSLHTATVGDRVTSIDPSRHLFTADPGGRVGESRPLDEAFNLAALATSAELLGAGERVLADSVAYVKQRKQFGREIGSYQAIKHQLANVRIALDFARPLVFGAAVDPTPRAVSAAKIQSANAADLAARVGLQVHGAIGYTDGVRPEPVAAPHPCLAVGMGHAGVPPRSAAHRSPGRAMTDLVPTREHTELATSVRNLLEKRSDSQAVRRAIEQPAGFDTDLWETLCGQMGVAALAIPEEHGGAGFTLAETYVVLEELGRTLTPSPLLASIVASTALLAAGHEEPLERIAEGAIATLAWSGVTAEDGVLNGSAAPVLYGDTAEFLVIAAGDGLFMVDPEATGLTRTRLTGMDLTLGFARLDFDGVEAERITEDAAAALAAAHRVGTLATAALAVGCAQRGLDMTVAYTKEREQFGRPIGSFQALKHRMADMLVRVQMSRAGAWGAVQAHVHGAPNADRLAAAAASYCAESAMAVAAETIQLHGGIAITWEHDAHLVFKRAQALHQLFGLPHQQRANLV